MGPEERFLQRVESEIGGLGKLAAMHLHETAQRSGEAIADFARFQLQIGNPVRSGGPLQPWVPGGTGNEVGPEEVPMAGGGIGAVILQVAGGVENGFANPGGALFRAGGEITCAGNGINQEPVTTAAWPPVVIGTSATKFPAVKVGSWRRRCFCAPGHVAGYYRYLAKVSIPVPTAGELELTA